RPRRSHSVYDARAATTAACAGPDRRLTPGETTMKHAVQLFLAMAAAAGTQAHAAELEPLQPGSQVRGEITLSAPLNHSDGSRSRLYTVEIGERELVGFD